MATFDERVGDFIGVYETYEGDGPTPEKVINLTAIENIYFSESNKLSDLIIVSERINVSETANAGANFNITVNDNLKYIASAQAGKVISILINDNLGISDSVTSNAEYLAKVADNVKIQSYVNTYNQNGEGELEVDESLDCFVLNYDTVAISKYTHYNFNSFAVKNNNYLAANELGLYKLDTDTGEERFVKASIKTGMIEVSDGQQSVVEKVDIYHNSDGKLKLRVMTEEGQLLTGVLINPNDSVKANTIHLGKGTRAVYWQFELTNDDVTNFKLNEMKLYVVKTRRNT